MSSAICSIENYQNLNITFHEGNGEFFASVKDIFSHSYGKHFDIRFCDKTGHTKKIADAAIREYVEKLKDAENKHKIEVIKQKNVVILGENGLPGGMYLKIRKLRTR